MVMWAKVQFRYEATHRFPNMPSELSHVAFLENEHRHEFHCTVWVEVFHDNRDIEYLNMKRILRKKYDSLESANMDGKSCEMMARNIGAFVMKEFGVRKIKVEVLEDGENGAFWEPSNTELGKIMESL